MSNMTTLLEKHLTPEKFFKEKNNIDIDLQNEFEKKFKRVLTLYKSLSSLNAYRKIQKINIIKTPQTDDTILNLLNKITHTNYERISQKLLLKLKENNLISFIDQILKYSEKSSNNNNILLWKLIKYLYKEYVVLFKNVIKVNDLNFKIIKQLEEYIYTFINEFDISFFLKKTNKTLTNEEYNEFVDRNMNNSALFAKMRMICCITDYNDEQKIFNIKWRIEDVYQKLLKELDYSVSNYEKYGSTLENIINNILECLYIIIDNSKVLSSASFLNNTLLEFHNLKTKNKLSNKNKFRLMDIIDFIELKKLNKFEKYYNNKDEQL